MTSSPCPECKSVEGFDENNNCLSCNTHKIIQIPKTEFMSISETRVTSLETKIQLRDRNSERLTLFLLFISMMVAILIPTLPFWHPISILASVFIGIVPLGITTYYVKKTITIDRG